MNKAEEFLLKTGRATDNFIDNNESDEISCNELTELMEAYHQSRVNEKTKEKPYLIFNTWWEFLLFVILMNIFMVLIDHYVIGFLESIHNVNR